MPNDTLNIIKDGDKFQYQLSKLDSCQKYWIDISLTLKDTTFKRKCKNDWKMKPGIINLRIPKLDINEISCYYNLTHMNLTSTSAINSKFYYNLSEMNHFTRILQVMKAFLLNCQRKSFQRT